MRSDGSVGVGLLGAGGISRGALAPATHAATGAHLQAVAARDEARAAALGPTGRAYGSGSHDGAVAYRALLEDPEVDVVYVGLNNDAHLPWTLAALEAGKHVLCEKPLGLDEHEAARMHTAAAAAERLLVEAWWYRWHPRTQRAVELVRSGALGRVGRVEAEFSFDGDVTGAMAGNYRLDPARGGGALLDVGCYAVDACRWALGAGALEVVDAGGDVVGGVDVRAHGTLRPAGSPEPVAGQERTASVRCGIAGRDEQLVAVYGDEAALVLGSPSFTAKDAPCELHVRPLDDEGHLSAERTTETFDAVDPYRLMVEGVARAVRGERTWLPSAQDSIDIATAVSTLRARVVGSPTT
ncbi:Gfo/Idh/MocA family protein [Aquipuribacter nitratireducens]|uniref:Gfo/Idh/MocA family protein n=1 Tax=Aquipuribacter nitratireducens TaxID=650104 RepID=A0ABW0GM16_9MICO